MISTSVEHPIVTSAALDAPKPEAPGATDPLRAAAEKFETMFVAEMLKAAKVGEVKGPFTGGYGEEAFRSFLLREYAEAITQQGSFGIADQLYRSLQEKVASHG